MGWMNELEIEKKYKYLSFSENFLKLFSLRTFLLNSYLDEKLVMSNEINKAIELTVEGKKWLDSILKSKKNFDNDLAKTALFLKFYNHDLLVDIDKTNIDSIEGFLGLNILGNRIKFPWIFGKILYDRFYELFPGKTSDLNIEETSLLLKETPMGVFQLQEYIIGPFGLLKSDVSRNLLPTLSVPLWHCSDPSCEYLHVIELSRGKNPIIKQIKLVSSFIISEQGIASEWYEYFLGLIDKSSFYDDFSLKQLPQFIADVFSDSEIRIILFEILKSNSKKIRDRIPKSKHFDKIFSSSCEKIVEDLDKSQCLQLLLLVSDNEIIQHIERLIDDERIYIPPTEIRRSKVIYYLLSWLGLICECSKYGIRLCSEKIDLAMPRLRSLIEKLYENKFDLLDWQLRNEEGADLYEKLDNFLCSKEPESIIKELVFNNRESVQQTYDFLRFGSFISTGIDERFLINKILWKIGFDINIYPNYQQLFWSRLEELRSIVLKYDVYNEPEKSSIRSSGVNLFISIEEVLERSLAFITWALLSNHYFKTSFNYCFENSLKFMAETLNGEKDNNEEYITFDSNGKNNIYPLIKGFSILANLCKSYINMESDFMIPDKDLPGFYSKTKMQLFPFTHSLLILDLKDRDQKNIVNFLEEIYVKFEKSNICNLRNRIDHKDTIDTVFPTKKEIIDSLNVISEIINAMELNSFCPLVCYYDSSYRDKYGRLIYKYKDYKGRIYEIRKSTVYEICNLPDDFVPQIIIKSMHLGSSLECIRFKYLELSEFVKIWSNYPRRKERIKENNIVEV